MKTFVNKGEDFIVNTLFDGKPVQIFKYRGDMFIESSSGDNPGCCILDSLKSVELNCR